YGSGRGAGAFQFVHAAPNKSSSRPPSKPGPPDRTHHLRSPGRHPTPQGTPPMERISTTEAGRRLGVSPTQIRRLVAAGKLRSETQHRPQGTRLVVLWDAPDVATEDATRTPRERRNRTRQTGHRTPPGTPRRLRG